MDGQSKNSGGNKAISQTKSLLMPEECGRLAGNGESRWKQSDNQRIYIILCKFKVRNLNGTSEQTDWIRLECLTFFQPDVQRISEPTSHLAVTKITFRDLRVS